MPLIRAVTFDLWSTIWEDDGEILRHKLRAGRINEILEHHGYDTNAVAVRRALDACGQWSKEVRRQGHRDFPPEEQVPFLLRELGVPVEQRLIEEVLEPYVQAILEMPPPLLPGVPDALETVSRRYRVGLISNTGVSPGSSIRSVLESQGLKGFFSSLVFSNEVGFVKPHPIIFQRALGELDVLPVETVHIGDDAFADIGGAKRSGMMAIRYGSHEPMADASLTSYGDLPGLLEEIQRKA